LKVKKRKFIIIILDENAEFDKNNINNKKEVSSNEVIHESNRSRDNNKSKKERIVMFLLTKEVNKKINNRINI